MAIDSEAEVLALKIWDILRCCLFPESELEREAEAMFTKRKTSSGCWFKDRASLKSFDCFALIG